MCYNSIEIVKAPGESGTRDIVILYIVVRGKDKRGMNHEKSCGAIVYRKRHGNTEILLIKHVRSGCWSFPKGHMEPGENEMQTAIREIKEETNIDVSIDDPSFRQVVVFNPRRDITKEVVYFLAPGGNVRMRTPGRRNSRCALGRDRSGRGGAELRQRPAACKPG